MGREGADTLRGGAGTDTMFGGWDDDTVIGILRNAETGLDADESDYLNGGDGDDTLVIGQGDIATGGNGADSFVLGDWFAPEAEAARLMDMPSPDQIVLIGASAMAGLTAG